MRGYRQAIMEFRVSDQYTNKRLGQVLISIDGLYLGTTDANGSLRVADLDRQLNGRDYHLLVAFHSYHYRPYFTRIHRSWLREVETFDFAIERSPNPPPDGIGWGLQAIGGPINMDGIAKRTRVVVLDTGLDWNHPCLRVADGYQSAKGKRKQGSPPGPGASHGTSCASIIGGMRRGGQGLWGVLPGLKLFDIDVFDATQIDAPSSAIVLGLQWAIENGIEVLNLGIGSPVPKKEEEEAYRQAWQTGIVMIAPSGNADRPGQAVMYPAAYPYTLAIGAIGRVEDIGLDREGIFIGSLGFFYPSFNCYGPEVDLVAPGVEICSMLPVVGDEDLAYEYGSGTSEAACYATGAAAAVLAMRPELTRDQGAQVPETVREILRATAIPLSLPPEMVGAGLVNLAAAVSSVHHPR
jgi:subtilisin family serine protease